MDANAIVAALWCRHHDLAETLRDITADHRDGTSVGLFLRAPAEVAREVVRQRPALPDDTSPPHVTVLYCGALPAARSGELLSVTRALIGGTEPFRVRLADQPSYFPPHDGQHVAKLDVLDGPQHPLHRLRRRLWRGFAAAGIPFEDHWPRYRPHMTLQYLDAAQQYRGAVPRGSWLVNGLDVWGWRHDLYVPFR